MAPRPRRPSRWLMAEPERRHAVEDLALVALPVTERSGLTRRFNHVLSVANVASYWAGVGAECGGETGWMDLRRAGRAADGPRVELSIETARSWKAPVPGDCAEIV